MENLILEQLVKLSEQVCGLTNKVDNMENNLNKKIDSFYDELSEKIDSVHDDLSEKIDIGLERQEKISMKLDKKLTDNLDDTSEMLRLLMSKAQ